MTLTDVQGRLIGAGLQPNTLSVRKGVYTAKRSYFYGISADGSSMRDKVLKAFPNATVVDYGNHWHAFVGRAKAGSSQDSYLWVKFTLPPEE